MIWNRRRRRATAVTRDLADQISRILFSSDPIGLDFEDNTDEYDPEARAIASALGGCASLKDVEAVVHNTFVTFFDERLAGSAQRYRRPSTQIWELWLAHNGPATRSE